MTREGTPNLSAAAARCHSAGSIRNAAAGIIMRLFTGVRRPEGHWRAQPTTAGRPKGSKGGRLPPPLVPRAKRNKMQDSSMEEGENKIEESGHLVSVLQLFFMYFIIGECIYERDRFSVALYATEERSPEDEKL